MVKLPLGSLSRNLLNGWPCGGLSPDHTTWVEGYFQCSLSGLAYNAAVESSVAADYVTHYTSSISCAPRLKGRSKTLVIYLQKTAKQLSGL